MRSNKIQERKKYHLGGHKIANLMEGKDSKMGLRDGLVIYTKMTLVEKVLKWKETKRKTKNKMRKSNAPRPKRNNRVIHRAQKNHNNNRQSIVYKVSTYNGTVQNIQN